MLRRDAQVREGGDAWEGEWQALRHAIFAVTDLDVQGVHLYGSRASGFGENADVDATVIVPGREPVPVLQV